MATTTREKGRFWGCIILTGLRGLRRFIKRIGEQHEQA